MAKKKNIVEEFIVDNIGIPTTEPNEAYLVPVTIDEHYRAVTDKDNELSIQIDPTVPAHVKNITQDNILQWSSQAGDDKNWKYVQSIPAAVWDFIHPLNKRPSVTITDSTGREVISPIQFIGNNRIIITHAGAFSGEVDLN